MSIDTPEIAVSEPNVTIVYWEYLVPTHTDVGWVKGSAGFTGILLLLVLVIIVVCSQPFVRRSGHFEVYMSYDQRPRHTD